MIHLAIENYMTWNLCKFIELAHTFLNYLYTGNKKFKHKMKEHFNDYNLYFVQISLNVLNYNPTTLGIRRRFFFLTNANEMFAA